MSFRSIILEKKGESMAITLYHVSFNIDELLYKKFVLRVSNNTINEEDELIPRIS